jgi:hypothetical protein
MADRSLPMPLKQASGAERMFPILTAAQIRRMAAYGHARRIRGLLRTSGAARVGTMTSALAAVAPAATLA